MSQHPRDEAPHVVVIGYGPVASRLIEELLDDVRSAAIQLTVVGNEPREAYQRIRIGDVSVGRIEPEALAMDSAESLRASGVDLRMGQHVEHLDRKAKTVTLDDGTQLEYSKVVLATGAAPSIPGMRIEMRRGGSLDAELRPDGLPEGVIAMRDMNDALQMRRAVETGDPVVVLGGGVLGVEAALAVAETGRHVRLLHRGNVPMGRAVDTDAGMLLRRELIHRGVEVHSATDVTEVVNDDGRLRAVRTSLGERLEASLLVVCIGVTPRDELAKATGLPCAWGITVDADSRSVGDDDVFAIGDCASPHGRGAAGLIAPGWLQAEATAEAIRSDFAISGPMEFDAAGEPVQFPQAETGPGETEESGLDVVLVKSKTLNMACAGTTDVDPWDPQAPEVSTWSDPKNGQYLRIVTEGEQLLGFVSVGMPRTAAELAMHASRGTLPAADRTTLLAAEHATQEAELGPEDVLCRCAGTTMGQVCDAAASCSTVADISTETRAGTGCGTCHSKIEKILADYAEAKQPV